MALPASVANLQSSLCACVCVWVFVCYSHHVCMFAYMCALLVRVASRVCFHLLTWFILVCFLHFNKSKSLCRCGQLAYCIYTSPSMSAFKFTSQIMFVFVRLDCVKPFLPLLYMCVWLVVCALTVSIRPRCGALSCYTCPARPMWNCRKRLNICRLCRRLCRLDLNGFSSLNKKQLCRKEEHWFH